MQIPFDERAEEEVVGCAVATRLGAELALARLSPEDFYVPAHRRLLGVVAGLPDEGYDERCPLAAEQAEVDLPQVVQLVRGRCVMADTSGAFAFRVARVSRNRRAMAAFAAAYNAIGQGHDVEDALVLVEGRL